MKTITLPVVALAIILLAVVFLFQLIVNKRCRDLKEVLLQNCKELFDTIEELRDMTGKMNKDGEKVPSFYVTRMDDIAEREREITACLKNTIKETL